MITIYPVKLSKENDSLKIIWNNGKESLVSFIKLRDECPCVHCKGESVIFENYIPIKAPFKPAGFYDIEKIVPVGNYAIQIFWKDGHETGIYSWDYLLQME